MSFNVALALVATSVMALMTPAIPGQMMGGVMGGVARLFHDGLTPALPGQMMGGVARPSHDVLTPAIPGQMMGGVARPSHDVLTPALPGQMMGGVARPSHDVLTPAIPGQMMGGVARQSHDVLTPAIPGQMMGGVMGGVARQSHVGLTPAPLEQMMGGVMGGVARQSHVGLTPAPLEQMMGGVMGGVARQSHVGLTPALLGQMMGGVMGGVSRQSHDVPTPAIQGQIMGGMMGGVSRQSHDVLTPPSSQWSFWSEPFGFGTMQRTRTVMKPSSLGGIAIPVLETEDRDTGVRPTIQRTAQLMVDSFMKLRHIDLLIIIDSSGSIGCTDFNKAKTQLARLVGLLCPQPDPFWGHQQAALLRYSSHVDEIFDFNDRANTYQVQEGINGMSYVGGNTCTATTFDYASIQMLTTAKGMRATHDVKQAVLILSDGRSTCGGDAIAAANRLKMKADVYGLMIGDHSTAGEEELTAYVSVPISQHLFTVGSFADLQMTDVYRHSFFPAGFRLWNQLREHVATTQTLDAFKDGLVGRQS